MTKQVYLGMRPGDLAGKPYAKYWSPRMSDLRDQTVQGLLQSPFASSEGLAHRDCNQLLDPGYLPLENGFTRLPSGELYVAVHTPMPRVSGAMIDWWFGWHSKESQRYKLWHPRAHMAAKMEFDRAEQVTLTDREKYVDNISYVDEYIGNGVQRLAIQFRPPQEFYLNETAFEQSGIQAAICAYVGPAKAPLNFGKLLHLIRETDTGCEMRSRFWLGKLSLRGKPEAHIVNRLLGSGLAARLAVGRSLGQDMLVHCAMEMAHLASFLPDLYADYHRAEAGAR